MREWHLKASDPLVLTLASDVRLGPTDYCDDQIWEISLGGGDPPALAVETSYGLRARAMRIFPRFTLGDKTLSDPNEFAQPPVVHQVFPNFLSLTFAPFPDIDVIAEYWVPQPHALAGRVQITNNGHKDCTVLLEMVARLTPTEGQRMAPFEMQAATILSGQSGALSPVLFMTGGAKAGPGPYPSLALKIGLNPDAMRQVTWVQVGVAERQASFELARAIAAYKWEAERTRLELLNSSLVEIHTGEADWDTTLMLAQKQAIHLFVGPTSGLPNPSFVMSRQPDQGYSQRGDGSDYNHLWNGQSPLEAYYLIDILLPVAPDLAQGLVRNFLAIQNDQGFIDWKPGLGGQRSKILATPLITSLVWRIYEATEQIAFLEETFEALLRFIQTWFSREHDQDGDGIPEWDHPLQAGDEDHPVYSRWHSWSQGVDISTAESPALCAFLYRECKTLARIARILGREQEISELETVAERLKIATEESWNETMACYYDWDRDTHRCTHGEPLASNQGAGNMFLRREFAEPVRLLINLQTDETVRRHPLVFIHGKSASGNRRVERIQDEQFNWTPGHGGLTGQFVYQSLERIEIHGLEADDRISISSVGYDFQDDSTLTPLWAGIPSADRARKLVEDTLTNTQRFWRPFGIAACPQPQEGDETDICTSINLLWNLLLGQALIQYGYRSEATTLMGRLMKAIILNLKAESAFRRGYHAESGQGIGERNAVQGLAPLGLFLEILGVRLISPERVALNGINPFPWPVTVKYRGLTVLRQKEKSVVIFPDGQTVTISDPSPQIVSLE
jgi:Mannosylglycerate hydrolase MGH1-like glycoside hydrolase domain